MESNDVIIRLSTILNALAFAYLSVITVLNTLNLLGNRDKTYHTRLTRELQKCASNAYIQLLNFIKVKYYKFI